MGKQRKSHLLDFYGVECLHCDQMEPLLKRLEEETGLTFRRFEVWYNIDNLKLLQALDRHNACGGVPYFYNKKTRGWICGATTYANFKAFATGKAHEHFLSPPVTGNEENDFFSQFRGFFDRIKSEGLEKIKQRFEAGKLKAGEKKSAQQNNNNVGGGFVESNPMVWTSNGKNVKLSNQVARRRRIAPICTRSMTASARFFEHSVGQPL